jgi:hypothetical protein
MRSQLLVLLSVLLRVLALDPPDYSKDPFPPYPPVEGGQDPTTTNILGTRLYGWTGCHTLEHDMIEDAFNDMNKIMSYKTNTGSIDWKSKAAEDFFGPSKDEGVIDDKTRKIILGKQLRYPCI